MNLFALFQTVYQSFAKYGLNELNIDVIDLCLVRVFGNFIIAIPVICASGKNPVTDIPRNLRLAMLIRSISGVTTFTLLVFAAKYLPIFIVQIVFNTAPIWTSILQYFINNDKISCYQALCMIGCFTGVVVLALAKSPIFDHETQIEKTSQFYFGLMVIFLSAILFSVGGVLTRKMKVVHFSVIQFNYGFLAFLTLLIWVLVEYFTTPESEYGYQYPRLFYYGG